MVPNFELAVANIDGIMSILADAVQDKLTEKEADVATGKIVRAIREYVYNIPKDKELTNFNMYRYIVKLQHTYPEVIENIIALRKLMKPDKVTNLSYWLSGFANVVVMGILNTQDDTLDNSKIRELMSLVVKESILSTMLENNVNYQEVSKLLAEIFLSLKEITIEAKQFIKGYGSLEVLYYAELFYNQEEPEETLVVVWTINKDDIERTIKEFKDAGKE